MKLRADHTRAAYACASWLIGYPDETLTAKLAGIRELAGGLDPRLAEPLQRCVDALVDIDEIDRCARYVETFDTRRRGCLHLTYYSSGDTRRRGMELIDIIDVYRRCGVTVTDVELPDHLGVVLEFAAATSLADGLEILNHHRPGIELLSRHLNETASPWQGAVDAVNATLPKLTAAQTEAMLSLASQGPETEQVGLDGYGTGPVRLAMPTRRSEEIPA